MFPALITPFKATGDINEAALRAHVSWLCDKKIKGLYVCGSTGESFLMSLEERKKALEIVVDQVAGKKTIIAHIGAIHTGHAIELASHAENIGVDAVSAVPPFYFEFTKAEILQHYQDIVGAVGVPMIVYNFPGNTGVSFTMEDFDNLLGHPKIIGVKHTFMDLYQLERIKSHHKDAVILFGKDEAYLGGYAMGADGVIGSTYNLFPEQFLQAHDLFQQGKHGEALAMQSRINQVMEGMQAVGYFAALKYGVTKLGFDCGIPRKPFKPLADEQKLYLDKLYPSLM